MFMYKTLLVQIHKKHAADKHPKSSTCNIPVLKKYGEQCNEADN